MLIRPATSQDAEQILSINFKARKEGYRGLIDQAYLETRVITPERIYKFAEKIQSTKHCLVYENETYELLGYIDVGTPRDENIAYGYEVHSFYVLPEYQRIGIGSQLWTAFQQDIQGQSFYLWTLAGSKGEQFYLKHGGKVFGTSSQEIGGKNYSLVGYAFTTVH